jgi:hypothetical protein
MFVSYVEYPQALSESSLRVKDVPEMSRASTASSVSIQLLITPRDTEGAQSPTLPDTGKSLPVRVGSHPFSFFCPEITLISSSNKTVLHSCIGITEYQSYHNHVLISIPNCSFSAECVDPSKLVCTIPKSFSSAGPCNEALEKVGGCGAIDSPSEASPLNLAESACTRLEAVMQNEFSNKYHNKVHYILTSFCASAWV